MSYTAKIALKDPETGKPYQVEAEFTDSEKDLLENFSRLTHDLFQSTYITAGTQASLTISWKKGEGTRIATILPKRDVADAFLYRFRPFVLENEATHFTKVCGLLGRKFDDPLVRVLLRNQRDVWTGKRIRSVITISDNFGILNGDEALMKWLNAFEYHRDQEKLQRIEPARQFMSDEGIRAFYLMLMTEKARAVSVISAFVELVLGKREGLTINLEKPLENAS